MKKKWLLLILLAASGVLTFVGAQKRLEGADSTWFFASVLLILAGAMAFGLLPQVLAKRSS
jgi:predicted membrane channel-forming protein YqfA (hemolysin III family)